MTTDTRVCGYCMSTQLAGHLLEHVKGCWPEASRRNEVFIHVDGGAWRLAALEPSDIPPRPDSPYMEVEVQTSHARLRSLWEPIILGAVNLAVEGDYPLPRGMGWILIDLIGPLAA